jgi:hypothetical protein
MAAPGRIQIPRLSQASAAAFDRYEAAGKAKHRADRQSKRADERRKVAMAVVIEELGSASLGMLPDGRVLHHTIETREFPALPAKVVSWDRLTEAVLG